MGKLDGKVAIVTGASRGIGKDIAVCLGREGAAVTVAARTESEGQSRIPGSLHDTVELVQRAGGRAIAVRCDVTSDEDIKTTVERTLEAFGRLDILVNNVGILLPGSTEEMEPRYWDLAFRVNIRGPFSFCRAAIPPMATGGGGHIINISSRGAIGPGPGPYKQVSRGGTAYGATKAALERFTQGLAAEIFPKNISVNALSPHRNIWSEGGHYFRSRGGAEPSYAGWRMNAEIMGDAVVIICTREPTQFTGRILYDELLMMSEGGMKEDEVLARYPVQS